MVTDHGACDPTYSSQQTCGVECGGSCRVRHGSVDASDNTDECFDGAEDGVVCSFVRSPFHPDSILLVFECDGDAVCSSGQGRILVVDHLIVGVAEKDAAEVDWFRATLGWCERNFAGPHRKEECDNS